MNTSGLPANLLGFYCPSSSVAEQVKEFFFLTSQISPGIPGEEKNGLGPQIVLQVVGSVGL